METPTYKNPAVKYTGKLAGTYTGDLEPPKTNYTRLLNAIINGEEMPLYDSELCKLIYIYYGGTTEVSTDWPHSRIGLILWFGIYGDRYTLNEYVENDILRVQDSITGTQYIIHLNDDLEQLWAKIVFEGGIIHETYYLRTTDGLIFSMANGAKYSFSH